MSGQWLAALLAGYGVAVTVAARRLLFPGIGRPCPPLPPWLPSRMVAVGGMRVHVGSFDADGASPVCVLQHGLGECGGTLAAEVELLRRLGFGIIVMDLPGHGHSSRQATTYGVRESRVLRLVIDTLGLTDRVTVVWGRSVGAAAVLRMAPTLPALRAVILDGMFDNPLRSIIRHALERPRFRALIPLLPGVLALLYLFLLGASATRFPMRIVATVDLPVLFITGSKDVGMPPRVQRRLLARARHADSAMVEVPDAGHYGSFARSPESFERWLVRYGAARSPGADGTRASAAGATGEARLA